MADTCDALDAFGPEWGSAWLDGELAARESAVVRAHLGHCAVCAAQVSGLRRTRALLRSLPVRRLPDDVRAAVPESAVIGDESRPARRRRLGPRIAAVGVVVLGFVGGAAFALGGEPVHSDRVVPVPVDVFAGDHVARTTGGPLSTTVLVEGGP